MDLDPTLSVLDGLLQAKDRQDGSLGVRCSCRAAICGSCGVKVNGQSTLACKTQVGEAQADANRVTEGRYASTASRPGSDPIVVEPMGNMPVIKDLVTDMESTHWAKVRRVTPWLLDDAEPPEREHIVPHESMVDITQTISCIQCGACVSRLPLDGGRSRVHRSRRSRQGLPVRRRPTRRPDPRAPVGPRPGPTWDLRLHPLLLCIDACPKGVAPMDQIMRLRRLATHDEEIDDLNNGRRHEAAFTKIIQKKGTLDESLLLQESFAPGVKGKLIPRLAAIKGLVESIPTALRGIRSGKMRSLPKLIPGIHHKLPDGAQEHVQRIYEHAEEHREELNLYITGEEGASPSPQEELSQAEDQPRSEGARHEARLLARLRLARLHDRAARLDGAGRRRARNRAGHARPRQLLRRRCDRRAQPGARRHAQRAHLRPGSADRPGDDEHLLDLPGRAVGVPAAPRRRLRLP